MSARLTPASSVTLNNILKAIKAHNITLLNKLLSSVDAKVLGSQRDVIPLGAAALEGSIEMTKIILAHGCDPNSRDKEGRNALHYCTDAKLVRLLVQAGCSVNATQAHSQSTALHVMTALQRPSIVRELLKHGADVNSSNSRKETPLLVAVGLGDAPLVSLLLSFKARTDVVNQSGLTPLMVAAMSSRPRASEIVKRLIKAKANIEARSPNGQTALRFAANGRNDQAMLLVRAGADVNARDKWNATPLLIAVDRKMTSLSTLLLKYGADPDVKIKPSHPAYGELGPTARDAAIRLGSHDILKAIRQYYGERDQSRTK